MSRKALTDQKYELIKAHMLSPEQSPLPKEHQEQLDRILSVAKILDKNPIQKNAVALHLAKEKNKISKSQAYEDVKMAMRLFNTIHTFDYDFWRVWLLNDIVKSIQDCRNSNDAKNRRIIAMEHANMIKVIGEKPEEEVDPTRNEKHNFYVVVNQDNRSVKVDLNNLHLMPEATRKSLTKLICSNDEISEVEASEIMKT